MIKSLDVIGKAANIPSINEDGLIRNLTVTVEHLFMNEIYVEGVKNVMKVLDKAKNSRRIADVWRIYESISGKIPLLDEKDIEEVAEEDKKQFEKTFDLNHDRFYDEYSEHMIQAFKRFLEEGEYI